MRSRTFLHVSLAILALAAAYHLGARSATAQVGSAVQGMAINAGCSGGEMVVITDNGDVYKRLLACPGLTPGAPVYLGNFWGSATPVGQESMGAVKARYR